MTDRVAIDAAVKAADERFGRIDVLVNNAGYGYQASIEEGDDAEIREQFDANVFGLFAMTRAVLAVMRRQRSGHILNLTSQAGFIGFPGSGYYAATKHAVEGFSDALAAEGAPLGIQVTCVAPGPFRTDWAGRSLRQTPNRIGDYAETAGARLKMTSDISGKQAGDPVRAGEAMIRVTEMEKAPRHLVLGKVAFEGVTAKLRQRLAEIESLKDESCRPTSRRLSGSAAVHADHVLDAHGFEDGRRRGRRRGHLPRDAAFADRGAHHGRRRRLGCRHGDGTLLRG